MAVTANQIVQRTGDVNRQGYPVAASTMLYENTLGFINSSGYLDDDTATGANPFAGVVVAKVDNSAGSAGALKAEVYTKGRFLLTGSGFNQANVGDTIYASDNFTITATSTNNTAIGRCVEYVSATQLWVEIRPLP